MASRKPAGRTPAVRSSPTAPPSGQRAPGAKANGARPAGAAKASGASTAARNGAPAPAARAGASAAPPGSQPGRPPRTSPRTWLRQLGFVPIATFILSLYGLGASIYLTIAHFDHSVTLVCSDKGLINCEEVTTSSQSMVFGVLPVAVLGLAFYLFMVAINSPWGWQLRWPAVRWARLGSVVVGMGFVLYLIYAEVDQIRAICLWCTSVHVATFLIFVLLVFQAAFSWGQAGTDQS